MSKAVATATQEELQEIRSRKLRRLNDMQLAPVKSLPMMMFMLWMSGNDIHIFSIMITGTAVYQPIGSALGVNATFKQFEDDPTIRGDVWRAKAVYLLCCVVAMIVGLVKLSWMGLMPVSAVDWLDHSPPTYATLAVRV